MTATQLQLRRDNTTNLTAAVPAAGEPAYNTSTGRLHVGDGSTPGGLILPLAVDLQKQSFHAATATGTADALVLAIAPVPAAWTTMMVLEWKAASNNTGAATITVTGLTGTKTLKKRTSAGLADLAADDMIADGTYRGVYNGTYVVIDVNSPSAGGGGLSVSQGDINTSSGAVSAANGFVTLPGGEYGFFPQCKGSGSSIDAMWVGAAQSNSYVTGIIIASGEASTQIAQFAVTNGVTTQDGASRYNFFPALMGDGNDESPTTGFAQQRYVTSSPPFDYGDGIAGGFASLLLNSNGGPVSSYIADVPPWAYNGPTIIRCDKFCPVTKKKFRRVMKKRSLEEIMDGAKVEFIYEEITQAIKNADMNLIPHPFGKIREGLTPVMLDPMDDRMPGLIDYLNAGGGEDILKAFHDGKIYADNEALQGRKGPAGVMQAPLRFKYSRK